MQALIKNGVLYILPQSLWEVQRLEQWRRDSVVSVESILPEDPTDDVCVLGKSINIGGFPV